MSPNSKKRTVLVVDNDSIFRDALTAVFTTLGTDCEGADSGPEAIRKFQIGRTYDLVVLDYFMPGMTGGETLQQLHAMAPSQRFLMVSGVIGREIRNLATAVGAATLRKPFSTQELREALPNFFEPYDPNEIDPEDGIMG